MFVFGLVLGLGIGLVLSYVKTTDLKKYNRDLLEEIECLRRALGRIREEFEALKCAHARVTYRRRDASGKFIKKGDA